MTFDEIMTLSPQNRNNFEALVNSIKHKTIVPFLGAGFSVPFYTSWAGSLDLLLDEVALEERSSVKAEMESKHNEIDRCDVLEKAIGKKALCRALCKIFSIKHYSDNMDQVYDKAIAILPRLFPDTPVLTTNLERMIEEVYKSIGVPFVRPLTPFSEDVLQVLNQQRSHAIMYLHGCVYEDDMSDINTFVFSRGQYEKHYQESSPLLIELSKWMQNSQLFFLGCSLRNDRSLDLLAKICKEKNRIEHFAILDLKDEDTSISARIRSLDEDYGIRAIIYPKDQHEAVNIILSELLRLTNIDLWTEYKNTLPQKPIISLADDVNRFRPEVKNTELFGREEELKALNAFCDDVRPFLWWAVIAPGGSGKTRLLHELGEKRKKKGWSVCWLEQCDYKKDLPKELQSGFGKILVISDYAGDNAKTLIEWIVQLSSLAGRKIRLLLAERDYDSSVDKNKENQNNLFNLVTFSLYDKIKGSKERLKDLNKCQYGEPGSFLKLDVLKKESLYQLMNSYARKVYNHHLDKETIETIYEELQKIDPDLCRPLWAMFITDAWVHKENKETKWDREDILNELIDRDENHLLNKQMECLGLTEADRVLAHHVTMVRIYSTVLGKVSGVNIPYWIQAKERIETKYLPLPIDFVQYLQLADITTEAKNKDIEFLPIKPDLLGEYYVIYHSDDAYDIIFSDNWLKDIRRSTFVRRLIQDFGNFLPHEFWNKMLDIEVQNDIQALSFMQLIFVAILSVNISEKEILENKLINAINRIYDSPLHNSFIYACVYSIGLFNISINQQLDKHLITAKKLQELHQRYSEMETITMEYARCLFNLFIKQDLDGCLNTLDRLSDLLDESDDNPEIAVLYAKCLVVFSIKYDLDGHLNTADKLHDLFYKYDDNTEIVVNCAEFLADLSSNQNLHGLLVTADILHDLFVKYDDIKIAKAYATCLANLSAKQNHNDLLNTADKLHYLLDIYDDTEIAKAYATCLAYLSAKQNHNDCLNTVGKLHYLLDIYDDTEIAWDCARGLSFLAVEQDPDDRLNTLDKLHNLLDKYDDIKIAKLYANFQLFLPLPDNLGFDSRLSIVDRLCHLFDKYNDAEIAEAYAHGLFILAAKQDLDGCLNTLDRLHDLLEKYNNIGIAVTYVKGLAKLFIKQDPKSRLNTLDKMHDLLNKYDNCAEIARVYANCLSFLSAEQDYDGRLNTTNILQALLLKYDDAEIAVTYAYYLLLLIGNQDLDGCLNTANILRELLLKYGYTEIAVVYANALFHLSTKQDLDGCLKTVDRLRNLLDVFDDNTEIAAAYANALTTLSFKQDLDDLLNTVDSLRNLLDKYDDIEIAVAYADALFYLSAKQDLDGCLNTADRLRKLLDKYDNTKIAVAYANALFDLSAKQDLDGRLNTTDRLRKLLDKYENTEIAVVYADSLFNLATAQDLDGRMNTTDKLRELLDEYDGNDKIAVAYAKAMVSLLIRQDFDDRLSTADILRDLLEKYDYNNVIAVVYASALAILSVEQDLDGLLSTVDRLGNLLNECDNPKIAVIYAKCLVNLSAKQDLDDSLITVDRLRDLLNKYDNPEIAVIYAICLYNLITKQDLYGCLNTIDRLHELFGRYNDNSDIVVAYAKGLFNLSVMQDLDNRLNTVDKIRKLYEDNRDNSEIEEVYYRSQMLLSKN